MLRLALLTTFLTAAATFVAYRRRRLPLSAITSPSAPPPLLSKGSRRQSGLVLVRPKSADRSLSREASLTKIAAALGPEEPAAMGIVVHGCHLQADSWEDIVWGIPPHQLGRLPHAAHLAWEERAHVKCVVFGTGASTASDGRLEGQYTLDLLLERMERLREFDAFRTVPLPQLEQLIRRIAVAEVESTNTVEEVRCALRLLSAAACHRAVLVSSPTHLPRCLACACRVEEEEPDLFDGSVWASPSDTSYHNFSASDVVVVEPPHRGDRDHSLDRLPFHEMVKRSYRVSSQKREGFLEEFDKLLKRYGV
jgi:hypothetical protein